MYPEKKSPKDRETTSPASKKGKGLSIILVLCAAAILGGGLYIFDIVDTLENQTAQLQQRIAADEQTLKKVAQAIGKLKNNFATQTEKLESTQNITQEKIQQVLTQIGTQQAGWRLEEAQELIRLAKWQLAVTQDIAVALQLLNSADEQIKLLNDPRLQFVREAIANDKLSVERANTIDIDGVLAKIVAIRTAIPQLHWPLDFSGAIENQALTNTTASSNIKSWRDKLWASVEYIKHFLVIRRNNSLEDHILDSSGKANVVLIIDLALLKSDIGLLRRDTSLYLQGLQQARDTIMRYFNTTDEQTKTILEQFDTLAKLTFAVPLPNLDESLTAIHEAIVKTNPEEMTTLTAVAKPEAE